LYAAGRSTKLAPVANVSADVPADTRLVGFFHSFIRCLVVVAEFIHERHKPPSPLDRPRELVLACAPLRSNVNLSHIVRTAGCAGLERVICCGHARLIDKIARDGAETVKVEVHRTLSPVLRELRQAGFRLVGLEQTTNSQNLHTYPFVRKTALVVGNERLGLTEDALQLLHEVVEIPVYGLPHAYNVATAAALAIYEYCRQFPAG
jgi:tRNA G18 (ribose-2'-O)-methylase SpoU